MLAQNWHVPLLLMFLVLGTFLLLHLRFLSRDPRGDIRIAAMGLLLGTLLDGSMFALGLISPGHALSPWPRECRWVVLFVTFAFLWTTFSLSLNSMLKVFHKRTL